MPWCCGTHLTWLGRLRYWKFFIIVAEGCFYAMQNSRLRLFSLADMNKQEQINNILFWDYLAKAHCRTMQITGLTPRIVGDSVCCQTAVGLSQAGSRSAGCRAISRSPRNLSRNIFHFSAGVRYLVTTLDGGDRLGCNTVYSCSLINQDFAGTLPASSWRFSVLCQ